ncbi:exosome complex component RRP42 [Angomonas deanei]|uniref:3' exoribonuclease family, domain 1, putative n=1 Tax=Angomonas deanei TaxID=59799 RepID=S9VDK3_9TRYP|nr:exosome complex component RRP42 [Angomonas deanei]EPY38898.1 exosome complex component RRP42 [Angomonas deanei]EPY42732.1 exosome complex component RRP42 [Angomonas deanei]CAD2215166.1 3' exoribonuclease family, domain 1, putative [Angomonas deanei]|eukprot:EPY25977.1 exosome complex component RRP42 [Angomonas deanei]
MFSALISNTEVRNIHEGVAADVREDGRSRLQRRPVQLRSIPRDRSYNGSRVEVSIGQTTVVASSSPSVEEGEGGRLRIAVDMTPSVVDFYGDSLGGRNRRYRAAYTAFIACAVQRTFGAESVEVRDSDGVAEAERPEDGEEEGEGFPSTATGSSGGRCGFPVKDLTIGKGYAFTIDVDVHILQATSGNALGAISLAVRAALQTTQLPAVTLHEGAAGVAVEVDVERPFSSGVDWSRLPVLCVLHLSPTRHYLVDPNVTEELALPQLALLAVNLQGQVCYSVLRRHPCRHGDYDRVEGEGRAGGVPPPTTEVTCEEWLQLVSDAVHIGHSTIADLESRLAEVQA